MPHPEAMRPAVQSRRRRQRPTCRPLLLVRGLAVDLVHARKRQVGHAFVHQAGRPPSRLAYSEVLADEQEATAAEFWLRAAAYFASMGIVVERVLTDKGSCYRSRDFATALGNVRHFRTRPYRPATNGTGRP